MPLSKNLEVEILNVVARLPILRELAGKYILLTGGTGMLGSYIGYILLSANRSLSIPLNLTLLVRSRERAEGIYRDFLGESSLHILEHDLTQPLPGSGGASYDYIIHAASQASPLQYINQPLVTFETNVLGTMHLLNQLVLQGRGRMLFVGSSSIYGELPAKETIVQEEDHYPLQHLDPSNSYTETKRTGEVLCQAYKRQHGVESILLRLFPIIGPTLDLEDGKFASDVCQSFIRETALSVNDKTIRRSYLYLSDAVEGLFLALLRGVPGEAYNLGAEDTYNSEELVEELRKRFPQNTCTVHYGQGNQSGQYRYSIPCMSKLRALGWLPQHDTLSAFTATINQYNHR